MQSALQQCDLPFRINELQIAEFVTIACYVSQQMFYGHTWYWSRKFTQDLVTLSTVRTEHIIQAMADRMFTMLSYRPSRSQSSRLWLLINSHWPVACEYVVFWSAETRLERVVLETAYYGVLHLSPGGRVKAASCDVVDGSIVCCLTADGCWLAGISTSPRHSDHHIDRQIDRDQISDDSMIGEHWTQKTFTSL